MPESAPGRLRGGRNARKRQRADSHDTRARQGTALGRPFEPLDEAGMQRVHRAALELLQRVGMGQPTLRVRDLCVAHGCTVGDEGRVLFPASLIEDTLAAARCGRSRR